VRPDGAGGGVREEHCSARCIPDGAGWLGVGEALVKGSGHGWIVGDGWRGRTAHDSSTISVAESGVRDVEIEFGL
jgi:hypothetical protein